MCDGKAKALGICCLEFGRVKVKVLAASPGHGGTPAGLRKGVCVAAPPVDQSGVLCPVVCLGWAVGRGTISHGSCSWNVLEAQLGHWMAV